MRLEAFKAVKDESNDSSHSYYDLLTSTIASSIKSKTIVTAAAKRSCGIHACSVTTKTTDLCTFVLICKERNVYIGHNLPV